MRAHIADKHGDLLILVSLFGIDFCFIGGIAKLCVGRGLRSTVLVVTSECYALPPVTVFRF